MSDKPRPVRFALAQTEEVLYTELQAGCRQQSFDHRLILLVSEGLKSKCVLPSFNPGSEHNSRHRNNYLDQKECKCNFFFSAILEAGL